MIQQEPQRVALPALLRQGLVAFRETEGNQHRYRIRDNGRGVTYQFETWQFFVLEILPACEQFPKLASIFEDRFGRAITNHELDQVFAVVSEAKLLSSTAEAHPLVAAYVKKKGLRITLPGGASSSQPAAAAKGNGNGNGNGNGSKGKESSPVSAAAASNTYEFTAEQFRNQNKDAARLCQKIKLNLSPAGIKASENTIEWLNGVLQVPVLCQQVLTKNPGLRLAEEIKKLKDQTEAIRNGAFTDLSDAEKNSIRRLNRALIELLYPAEAPKVAAVDDTGETHSLFWRLFNPTALIKFIHPFLSPLKHAAFLIPAPILAAILTALNHTGLLVEDFGRFRVGMNFASHVLIGLFTDNILATLALALAAHTYRGTVNSFGIVLHFGFFPRFMVKVGNLKQMNRRERIWLHSAPLLTRLTFMSLCVLLWYGTREMTSFVPHLALICTAISAVSLGIAANPFLKGQGYLLLTALLNEPNLKTKAVIALTNKLRGTVYQKSDAAVLGAYSLVCSLFMLSVLMLFFLFFGDFLKMQFGAAGIVLAGVVFLLLLLRLSEKIRLIAQLAERSAQFDRWKSRSLPTLEPVTQELSGSSTAMTRVKWLLASFLVAALIVPYRYEPGGNFVLLPNQKSELTSDNSAVITSVYYDGGEFLNKGTLVAKLSTSDYEGQVKVFEAKVKEQQAVVDDLKSRPKPEEVELARRELDVRSRQARFSGEKLKRFEKLYRETTISFEELEDQRKQAEVDAEQVKEYRAKLELIEAGVTEEQIAAAEAKMQSYAEERDYYVQKIRDSLITMPFDGRLEGVNLKLKAGHFLNKGEVFAVAENTGQVYAQIEVPEPDIRYVAHSRNIRVRPVTFSDTDFRGVVSDIDTAVTEKPSGNVVKVLTVLDNRSNRLQAGMTGYAKVSAESMPLGKVLFLNIARFFQVEVWSWLP